MILWLSKCNIFKNATFIGVSLLSPSHVTGIVDFFIRFERARRVEQSHLRISCQIKTLEGAESVPLLYVRVTKIDLYVRVLSFNHQLEVLAKLRFPISQKRAKLRMTPVDSSFKVS